MRSPLDSGLPMPSTYSPVSASNLGLTPDDRVTWGVTISSPRLSALVFPPLEIKLCNVPSGLR